MFRAGVAHPVERHLAKVEVASSSLVARSIKTVSFGNGLFLFGGLKPNKPPVLPGEIKNFSI